MLPSTLPPNSARIGYAVEGVLITAHLSTDITPKSLVLLVPSKMFAKSFSTVTQTVEVESKASFYQLK